eukprot:s86_g6.t1
MWKFKKKQLGESAEPVDHSTGDAAHPTEEATTRPSVVKEEPGEPEEPKTHQAESAEASGDTAADVTPSAPAFTVEMSGDQVVGVPPSAHVSAVEAPPPTAVTLQVEPASVSRFGCDIESLTLNEIVTRMGLPRESSLTQDEGSVEPRRRRRRQRRARSDIDCGRMTSLQVSRSQNDRCYPWMTRSEWLQDRQYHTMPIGSSTPRRKDRKGIRAHPTESRESGASSSARPAAAKARPATPRPTPPATARGSVGISIPNEHGAVEANPPMLSLARRVALEDQAEPLQPKRRPPTPPKPPNRRPPTPPQPKRHMLSEPKRTPPDPKQRVAIAKAEAHLACIMANPGTTRTAKRKARREVRSARGELPPE